MGACFETNSLITSNINKSKSQNLNNSRKNIDFNGKLKKSEFFLNENIINNENKDLNGIQSLIKENGEKSINKPKLIEESNEHYYKCLRLQNSVKSKYIIKKIFSNLNTRKKLLLTRYNKFYNNLLGIDIELYKKISRKIKIGERNGFGKEYDLESLDLIFKGYYNEGKRQGFGKEFRSEKIIFEGEYVNGIRNGKGIEFNHRGELLFEGEYKDGKKWNGKAKEYFDYDYKNYENSYLIKFDGKYLNGKKIGKEYDKEGRLLFEGEYLNGKRWNGIIYNKESNCTNSIKNGNGIIKEFNEYNKLIFEGEYINGDKRGKEYDIECGKLIFEGEYLNGDKWNGKLIKYKKYKKYNDYRFRCGCGCFVLESDDSENEKILKKAKKYKKALKYEGEYRNDKKYGKGIEYDIEGKLTYKVEYINGKTKGQKKSDEDDDIYIFCTIFEGTIKNGKKDGIIKEYNEDHLIFEGEYSNGILNGKVKEYNDEGILLFDGEYLKGRRWNGKIRNISE